MYPKFVLGKPVGAERYNYFCRIEHNQTTFDEDHVQQRKDV